MTEYVTIKEFCKLAEVSPQSVYKKLKKTDNQLNNFIKLVDNKKMISLEALKLYQKEEPEQKQSDPEPEQTPESDMTKDLIEMLRKQLDEQSEQLKVKDKQIADLNERLAESQQMLNQQQHLNAIAEQKILTLESKEDPSVEAEQPRKTWWEKLRKK